MRHSFTIGILILTIGLTILAGATAAQEKMFIMPEDSDSSWFTYQLDPGEAVTDTMKITNNGDLEQTVRIVPVDAEATASGLFALKNPQSEQVGIGQWINLSTDIMTIDAHDQSSSRFSIVVPDDIPPGDYAGGIIIMPYEENSDTTTEGAGFATVVNVGVRVYITVNGDVDFNFSWDNFAHQKNDAGLHTFSYNFTNDGNVAVDSNGTISFESPFFETIEIPLDLGVVYAGKSTEPLVTWKEPFPFGPVKALTTVDYSRANVFGTLNEEEIAAMSGQLEKTTRFWIIPYQAIFATLLSFMIAFGILSYQSKRLSTLTKQCEPYTAPEDESLTTIAERVGIPWKKLAKLNKLKFPFIVAKNQTILVPGVHKDTPKNAEEKPLFPDLKPPQ